MIYIVGEVEAGRRKEAASFASRRALPPCPPPAFACLDILLAHGRPKRYSSHLHHLQQQLQ